tara:strand:+ start:6352 stop:6810 length:459 start_codon:yes stop_codon:yes gene_type:complete
MNQINIPASYEIIYELQRSIFLKNILEPYFEFVNETSEIVIYEKKNEGREKVSRERLIYFMHCKMPTILERTHDELYSNYRRDNSEEYLLISDIRKHYKVFHLIDNIHRAIDNLKIIFENYEVEKKETDNNETENSEEFVDLLLEMNKTKFD